MSNLTLIKPTSHKIQIGDEMIELKYTLESFAFLEQEFDTVEKAIELFNTGNRDTIIKFIIAGIRNSFNIEIFNNMNFNEELISQISAAFTDSLPLDYQMEDLIDWSLLYYIIKPLLHLSEDEFWDSTPKKLIGLFKAIEKCKESNTKITNQNQAIQEFIKW